MIRILRPGDENALEAFLRPHADTSMFLRSNARRAGLDDHGEPLQATYAASFDADAITAVAAHCWNGILLVQAPECLREVTHKALSTSGRTLKGISGPADQVQAARDSIGVRQPTLDDAGEEDLPQLIAWREQYLLETGLATPGPLLRHDAKSGIELLQAQGDQWLLEDAGNLVAYTAFNARLPEIVQVGGVWTPLPLRGRGYARCAVAGSLLEARAGGARRAILFTSSAQAARAYQALGFEQSGRYGLLIV